MKIVKSSKPYDMSFDEYDIDNVLIYRIEEIQKFCMDYFNEINEQIKTYYDLTLFKTYSYEDLYAGIYLLKYIDWFANQDYMNSTIPNNQNCYGINERYESLVIKIIYNQLQPLVK